MNTITASTVLNLTSEYYDNMFKRINVFIHDAAIDGQNSVTFYAAGMLKTENKMCDYNFLVKHYRKYGYDVTHYGNGWLKLEW